MEEEVKKLWDLGSEEEDVHGVFGFLSSQKARASTQRKCEFAQLISQDIAPEAQMGERLPYVSQQEMTEKEFAERFLIPNRPCMITGCSRSWRAASRWSSSKELCKWYGHVQVRVTEVQQMSYPNLGGGNNDCQPLRVALRHYLPYAEKTDADFPWYAFDDDFSDSRAALLEDFAVPELFNDDCYSVSAQVRNRIFPKPTFFVAGGARSGTVMHTDPHATSAWNTLLCGKKRWILIPPTDDAAALAAIGIGRSYEAKYAPCQWWADVYPALVASGEARRLGAIEFVQEAGDTVYVPSGWWHTVLNLNLTAAITANFLQPCNLLSVWPSLTRLKRPKKLGACPKKLRARFLTRLALVCHRRWPAILGAQQYLPYQRCIAPGTWGEEAEVEERSPPLSQREREREVEERSSLSLSLSLTHTHTEEEGEEAEVEKRSSVSESERQRERQTDTDRAREREEARNSFVDFLKRGDLEDKEWLDQDDDDDDDEEEEEEEEEENKAGETYTATRRVIVLDPRVLLKSECTADVLERRSLDEESCRWLAWLVGACRAEIVLSGPCRLTAPARQAAAVALSGYGIGFTRWITTKGVIDPLIDTKNCSGNILEFVTRQCTGSCSWLVLHESPVVDKLTGCSTMMQMLLHQHSIVVPRGGFTENVAKCVCAQLEESEEGESSKEQEDEVKSFASFSQDDKSLFEQQTN